MEVRKLIIIELGYLHPSNASNINGQMALLRLFSAREELEKATPEDERDRDDEKPTVVVLKSGDLTAEEAAKLGAFEDDNEGDVTVGAEDASNSGRVVYRKPTKRSAETLDSENEVSNKIGKKESSMKKVKNKTLLSFDDEEDDDSTSD